MGRVKGRGERKEKTADVFPPLPSPSPLSFFRPCTYPKGYYFYSPQSSTVIKSKMAATTMRTQTRFRPAKIRLHCRLAPQTKLNSGWVRLRNSAGIRDLGPHVCTRIWLRAMIGLLKKPLWICKSRWKEIQNAIPVIGWVCWGPRTRISALLCRRYWPRLNCVYDAGLELGAALRDETKTAAWETRKWKAIESRASLNAIELSMNSCITNGHQWFLSNNSSSLHPPLCRISKVQLSVNRVSTHYWKSEHSSSSSSSSSSPSCSLSS